MNEITVSLFSIWLMFAFAMAGILFFFKSKIKILVGILASISFISLAQIILSEKVVSYYANDSGLQSVPITSLPFYYFLYAMGIISLVYSTYEIYQFVIEVTKEKSAFGDEI